MSNDKLNKKSINNTNLKDSPTHKTHNAIQLHKQSRNACVPKSILRKAKHHKSIVQPKCSGEKDTTLLDNIFNPTKRK